MTASEHADTQINLIWLSEQYMIDAGVTDTAKCVETMEETLILLDKGDYRLAGASANSHGAQINFPDEPEHEGMPAHGPDRRFMAMPRSEEHTSELQSRGHLVCRLPLGTKQTT